MQDATRPHVLRLFEPVTRTGRCLPRVTTGADRPLVTPETPVLA